MPDPEFVFLGDALWLDFVNTARGRGRHADRLPDAAAYHRWTRACKLASDAEQVPFPTVRRLRGSLSGLVDALHAGRAVPPAAIAAINALLAGVAGRQQITRYDGSWHLRFAPSGTPRALAAVAHSAAATLGNPAVQVRVCAGKGCDLAFVDATPTLGRPWCSPECAGTGIWVERRRGRSR